MQPISHCAKCALDRQASVISCSQHTSGDALGVPWRLDPRELGRLPATMQAFANNACSRVWAGGPAHHLALHA